MKAISLALICMHLDDRASLSQAPAMELGAGGQL